MWIKSSAVLIKTQTTWNIGLSQALESSLFSKVTSNHLIYLPSEEQNWSISYLKQQPATTNQKQRNWNVDTLFGFSIFSFWFRAINNEFLCFHRHVAWEVLTWIVMMLCVVVFNVKRHWKLRESLTTARKQKQPLNLFAFMPKNPFEHSSPCCWFYLWVSLFLVAAE